MKSKITVEIEYDPARPLTKLGDLDLVTNVVITGINNDAEFGLKEDLKRTLADKFNSFLTETVKINKPVRMFNLFEVLEVLNGWIPVNPKRIAQVFEEMNAEEFAPLLIYKDDRFQGEISETGLDLLIRKYAQSKYGNTPGLGDWFVTDKKEEIWNQLKQKEEEQKTCYYKGAIIDALKMHFGIPHNESHLHIPELKTDLSVSSTEQVYFSDTQLKEAIKNICNDEKIVTNFLINLKLYNQQFKSIADKVNP